MLMQNIINIDFTYDIKSAILNKETLLATEAGEKN